MVFLSKKKQMNFKANLLYLIYMYIMLPLATSPNPPGWWSRSVPSPQVGGLAASHPPRLVVSKGLLPSTAVTQAWLSSVSLASGHAHLKSLVCLSYVAIIVSSHRSSYPMRPQDVAAWWGHGTHLSHAGTCSMPAQFQDRHFTRSKLSVLTCGLTHP